MPFVEAVIGFVVGVVVGIILWFPLFYAPVALFGDVNAEMPGWAVALSIWFYFICGVVGGVIAWVSA